MPQRTWPASAGREKCLQVGVFLLQRIDFVKELHQLGRAVHRLAILRNVWCSGPSGR